jgi:hypothetical protein
LVGGAGSFIVALAQDQAGPDGLRAGDLLVVEPVGADELDADDLAVFGAAAGATVRKWAAASDDARSLSGRLLSVIRRVREPQVVSQNLP